MLTATGRRLRLAVTATVFGLLLTGTALGQDDAFPFGPFRMYATRDDPNGLVVSTRVEAVDATGRVLVVPDSATGLRRAEIEGQVGRFRADPRLLAQISRAHDRLHPDQPAYDEVRVVQRRYRLRDSRPTGEQSEQVGGGMASVTGWLMQPAPLGRIAALRTVAYLFVPVDVLLTTPWVVQHADVPGALYQPLLVGRLLELPTPGGWVEVLRWALVAACLVAATGRLPRLLGAAVAVMYLEWMVVAFSYGKVDHDRVGFLVLLAVLPSVGRARYGDRTPSEAAGWAISMTTLAVVATYFLSAFAKLRFGGLDWVDGATLTRAVVRRGTALSTPLLDHAWALHAFQYVLVVVELVVSPLLLVRWRDERITWALVGGFSLFHLMTFLTISIVFLPHCVALLALLPLERFAVRRLKAPMQRELVPT